MWRWLQRSYSRLPATNSKRVTIVTGHEGQRLSQDLFGRDAGRRQQHSAAGDDHIFLNLLSPSSPPRRKTVLRIAFSNAMFLRCSSGHTLSGDSIAIKEHGRVAPMAAIIRHTFDDKRW